jgi:hypothetical protein
VLLIVGRAFAEHGALSLLVREGFDPSPRAARVWALLDRRERLVEHPDATAPMVVGLWRPTVVLPEGLAAELSDEELGMVLAHEAAHLRRHDALASLYLFACFALFFFHPGVWLARREWRLDREAACDEEAMQQTGAPVQAYAAMLVRVSSGAVRAPSLALSAVPTYKTLQRRINDMKNSTNKQKGGTTWTVLAVLVAAGVVPFALVQRKPNFGAGVFETQAPQVKVSQERKGTGVEAVAAPVGGVPLATTAPVAGAPDTLPPYEVTATAGTAVPLTGVAMAQGVPVVPTAVAVAPSQAGPAVAVPSRGTTAVEAGPRVLAASPGNVALPSGAVRTTVAEDVPPMAVTTPVADESRQSLTIVMRDAAGAPGQGIESRVTVAAANVELKDFLRLLSRVSGVKISVQGVHPAMRLNAEIENAQLGEVLGTLSRVYGLEWRLDGDGVVVQPFRG